MKTIWSILSALAIGNVLAIAGFGAWLVVTDRLDVERASAIREMVQETIPQQQAREQAEAEQAEAEAEAQRQAEAEAADTGIPIMAGGVVQAKIEASEMDQQRMRRMQELGADLKESLRIEREELERGWAALQQERENYEAERQRIADIDGSEQFQTALLVFEGLRPGAAHSIMAQLLAGAGAAAGSAARGEELVVSYLNAMQDRQRNKIITEFEKDDPAVAARLLERLRTRGIVPGGGGAGAGEVADAPGP